MAPLGMACGAAWHGARQAAAKANARARSVAIITARKFRDRASMEFVPSRDSKKQCDFEAALVDLLRIEQDPVG